jgi:hypothetical protein
MRSFGFRLTFLSGILWAGFSSDARALGHFGDAMETVYVIPSSFTLPVATSYVVSASWAAPTAYAVPTYYTTAYWMDPVVLAQPTYAATAYVSRRGLFRRRWLVERPVLTAYSTSYVPTTYVVPAPSYRATSYSLTDPMVVPSAYVASADCPCPTAVASAAPTYSSPSRSSGATTSGGASRSRAVRSEADDRASMSSNVEPPPENLNPVGSGEANANATETAPSIKPDLPARIGDNTDNTPPPPPAAAGTGSAAINATGGNPQGGASRPTPAAGGAGQTGGAGSSSPGGGTNPNPSGGNAGAGNSGASNPGLGNSGTRSNPGAIAPPTAPAAPADSGLGAPPPIGPSGETRRDSMRPSTYATRPARASFRNVLIGTVNSSSAGQPEEDVRVSVRNISTGSGKSTTTNAFGRFAVSLADGDWAVDVTMPSGRVYEVSRLRVSDGLITDSQGRRVPTLDITR